MGIGIILPFVKSDTIGRVSGFYIHSFRISEREVQMAENEQPYIPALVQKFVDPAYASGFHFGEGRQWRS